MGERERFTGADAVHRGHLLVVRGGKAGATRQAARQFPARGNCRDERRCEEAVQEAIRARLGSVRAPDALRARVLALVAAAGSSHGHSSKDAR